MAYAGVRSPSRRSTHIDSTPAVFSQDSTLLIKIFFFVRLKSTERFKTGMFLDYFERNRCSQKWWTISSHLMTGQRAHHDHPHGPLLRHHKKKWLSRFHNMKSQNAQSFIQRKSISRTSPWSLDTKIWLWQMKRWLNVNLRRLLQKSLDNQMT